MPWLDLGRSWLGLLALLVGWSALARADVDAVLTAEGWQEVTFDGKTPNAFTSDSPDSVMVRGDSSVSLIQRPIDVDLDATPLLTWRWRVEKAVPPTDLAIKGEDDRSLALYVAFPFQPEEAGVMERMKRAVVEAVAGEEAPGRVLMYVWGGQGARGDRVPSPHLGSSGMMTILRPAATESGAWFDEAVDIASDYREIFESEPPDPISIAIGADSDDTKSPVEATLADLLFTAMSNAPRPVPTE